jgi:hypothetical protein
MRKLLVLALPMLLAAAPLSAASKGGKKNISTAERTARKAARKQAHVILKRQAQEERSLKKSLNVERKRLMASLKGASKQEKKAAKKRFSAEAKPKRKSLRQRHAQEAKAYIAKNPHTGPVFKKARKKRRERIQKQKARRKAKKNMRRRNKKGK